MLDLARELQRRLGRNCWIVQENQTSPLYSQTVGEDFQSKGKKFRISMYDLTLF